MPTTSVLLRPQDKHCITISLEGMRKSPILVVVVPIIMGIPNQREVLQFQIVYPMGETPIPSHLLGTLHSTFATALPQSPSPIPSSLLGTILSLAALD